MIEEQKARIDDALLKVLEEVDKSCIRKLQGKMFRCAANCCDDKNSSMQKVQICIDFCSRPLETAQTFVNNEFTYFNDKLQRCIMICNDTIRDKVGTHRQDSEVAKYTTEFENCAVKCVDTHINTLPNLQKRIKEVLKKELN